MMYEKRIDYLLNQSQLTSEAAALYDGGWRDGDQEDLMKEYGLDQTHADDLCEVFKEFARRETEKVFDAMKEAIEDSLTVDDFIGNYDDDDDNLKSYGLVDIVETAENADSEFNWLDCFTDALDEIIEENELKLFSNNENLPLLYCKPENKACVVDFLRSDANVNLHIFIEEGIYTDYLKRIGFLKYNEQYDLPAFADEYIENANHDDEYIENENYDGEEPQSFDEFFGEWLEEASLI